MKVSDCLLYFKSTERLKMLKTEHLVSVGGSEPRLCRGSQVWGVREADSGATLVHLHQQDLEQIEACQSVYKNAQDRAKHVLVVKSGNMLNHVVS